MSFQSRTWAAITERVAASKTQRAISPELDAEHRPDRELTKAIHRRPRV